MPALRPSWDETWLDVAFLLARRTQCASGRSVGAVLVRDNRILATGYNGVPVGVPHPEHCERRRLGLPSGENPHLCGCVHAEANALANAARHGVSLVGSTAYLTCAPCRACVGLMANAGVREVVTGGDYPDPAADALAQASGLTVRRV
jgi:dCMP deaminase